MRFSSFFWGALLVILGILFLLDNTGILEVEVWNLFWPLLLIGFGLSILIDNLFGRKSGPQQLAIDRQGANKAQVRIRHGAGRLRLHDGAPPGQLLSGEFGGGVDHRSHTSGTTLNVTLKQPQRTFPFFGWGAESLDWDVSLSEEAVLSLDLETGANDSRIDLSKLLVSELDVRTGASATRITMPAAAGHTRADIRSGVASVTVTVPDGVAAAVRAQGGLASVEVDQARFPRQGQGYRSPDYETAEHTVELNVETGVGSVRVT